MSPRPSDQFTKCTGVTFELSAEQTLVAPTAASHVNVSLLLALPVPVAPKKHSCAAISMSRLPISRGAEGSAKNRTLFVSTPDLNESWIICSTNGVDVR